MEEDVACWEGGGRGVVGVGDADYCYRVCRGVGTGGDGKEMWLGLRW